MRTLRQHQQAGIDFINSTGDSRAILHHGMSSGKTLAFIRWYLQHAMPTLMVATLAAIDDVWVPELTEEGVPFSVISSTKPAEVRKALRASKFVLVNYEKVRMSKVWKVIEAEHSIRVLGIDEIHKTKNSNSATTKGLYRLQQGLDAVVGLTGTLYPKDPLDIHGQMKIVDPTLFDYVDPYGKVKRGIYKSNFESRYANTWTLPGKNILIPTGVRSSMAQELADKVATRVHTVKTEDVVELPDEIHVVREIQLPEREQNYHDEMMKEYIIELSEGHAVADNILVKILRLKQITAGFVPYYADGKIEHLHSYKSEAAYGILDEAEYEPVVVFYQFTPESELLESVIRKHDKSRGIYRLDGSHKDLTQWRKDERGVLLVQVQAGSESIDLTHASLTVFLGYPRNAGDYAQAIARTRRSNAKNKKVRYYHIICKNTIDELVLQALKDKKEISQAFENLYLG